MPRIVLLSMWFSMDVMKATRVAGSWGAYADATVSVAPCAYMRAVTNRPSRVLWTDAFMRAIAWCSVSGARSAMATMGMRIIVPPLPLAAGSGLMMARTPRRRASASNGATFAARIWCSCRRAARIGVRDCIASTLDIIS